MIPLKTVSRLMLIALCTALVACASSLDTTVQKAKDKSPTYLAPESLSISAKTIGGPDYVAQRAQEFQANRVIRRSLSPYIGGRMVSSTEEDSLPAVFSENYLLDFGNGRVSLAVVAARLTKITGIPVRLRPDVYKLSAAPASFASPALSTAVPASMPMPMSAPLRTPSTSASSSSLPAVPSSPAGIPRLGSSSVVSSDALMTVDAINMRWNGRLRDFLDHLTNVLSLAWEYRDNTVVVMRLVTESYEVAAFAGSQSYAMTNTGGGSGSSTGGQSSSSSINIAQKGEGDARKSIISTINSFVAAAPNSSISVSDGTGRIVVTTSREIHAQIRDYLKTENKLLRQMVNVTFDLYSYRTSVADTRGVDWSAVYKSLAGGYGLALKAPASLSSVSAGTVTGTILSGRFQDTAAVLALLRQSGQSFQHRPVSINTMNGHWNSKNDTVTEGYIKETVPGAAGASGAAGAPGLKTDTITTGDQYTVLSQVMQDNSVMVKYTIGLSDLLGLFDQTSGQGATLQKVQTPRTKSTSESATIILAPGQVHMITGLSRITAVENVNSLTESAPIALGGSQNVSLLREYFIVVVRATPI